MELQTFSHSPDNGWDVDSLPGMDSKHTLVLVFGSSGIISAVAFYGDAIRVGQPASQ